MIAALKTRLAEQLNRHAQVNWTLADQAVVSAANFFTALIVARFLGLEAFGVFSIAWMVLLFSQSFQIALILTPMLSIGAKTAEQSAADYYASVQSLQMGFALMSGAVVAGMLALVGTMLGMGESGPGLALPLALTITATQMHEFLRRYCFARGMPSNALSIDLVRYSVQFAAMMALFSKGEGSVHNALLVIGVSALLSLVILVRSFPKFSFQPLHIKNTLARHWNISRWLVPSALMQWASGNFFTIAAGALLGPVAVGAMRAAQNLMGVTHIFFQALDNWAPVRAACIHSEGGDRALQGFSNRLILITFLVTSLAVLVLVLPAELWLALLYGEEYASYGWIVVWYGLSYLVMSLHAPYRYVFIAVENAKPMFIGHVWAASLSVVSVYPLIDYGGLWGAMIGIAATQVYLLLTLVWYGHKSLYSRFPSLTNK